MMLAGNVCMLLAGEQPGADYGVLAALSFGIGIIALLYVFRRTSLQRRRGNRQLTDRQLRETSRRAKNEIAGIENREQYERQRQAEKFPRDGRELSPQQQAALDALRARHVPREES
jgi:hypothetical protein